MFGVRTLRFLLKKYDVSIVHIPLYKTFMCFTMSKYISEITLPNFHEKNICFLKIS